MTEEHRNVVIFDTDCALCSAWIGILLRHERRDERRAGFLFASSRKPVGQALAQRHGFGVDDLDLTYLVIRDGKAFTKSDAGLVLMRELRVPWRWLGLFGIVPKGLRDRLYDILARNRLHWLGKQKDCFLPSPGQKSRFLDDLPPQTPFTDMP